MAALEYAAVLMQVVAAGYASCTGLSIFLVCALRSVGIPARVVGSLSTDSSVTVLSLPATEGFASYPGLPGISMMHLDSKNEREA